MLKHSDWFGMAHTHARTHTTTTSCSARTIDAASSGVARVVCSREEENSARSPHNSPKAPHLPAFPTTTTRSPATRRHQITGPGRGPAHLGTLLSQQRRPVRTALPESARANSPFVHQSSPRASHWRRPNARTGTDVHYPKREREEEKFDRWPMSHQGLRVQTQRLESASRSMVSGKPFAPTCLR